MSNTDARDYNASPPPPYTAANDGEDVEEVAPSSLNLPSGLAEGNIRTGEKNGEFNILLVGETGVGKTSLLSLIGNVLSGHKLRQYTDMNDLSNEIGGSQSQSQTNMAKIYEFKSKNGVLVRILDTPGLADTRGIAQDDFHKATIAKAIQEHITVVNAVLIVANGTVPRLTVATDYALSTLTSIFPHTLVDNIGFVFTNVSSSLSWNFAQDSLLPALRNAEQFLLDNPLSMQKKYKEYKEKKSSKSSVLKQLQDCISQAEVNAIYTLSALFDWIDAREPQPTGDILLLYQQSQDIEKIIQNALARMHQAVTKKEELERIKAEIEKANVDYNTLGDIEKIIKKKENVQEDRTYRSMICFAPGCYHNCHEHCRMPAFISGFSGRVSWCRIISDKKCTECGHAPQHHRHTGSVWKEVERDERVVDHDAEQRFKEAKSAIEKKEASQFAVQKAIGEVTKDVDEAMIRIGSAAEDYAKLSLSGCFSSQVEKSIDLMKLNIVAMEVNNADAGVITKLKKSMEGMEKKLKVLRDAVGRVREQPNISRIQPIKSYGREP